ncbi:uncharacterized protein LOC128551856 [Mercenaria mercenaria]|uniref:uncharacterized protein LOC128551856 n=1 Tax=Mercenaria mercenaria TaxID=6596 RepID=UPI00234F7453|nr:uncharacterized protein LOC128551856 [Mercenaria mercenaria]
MKTNLFRKDTIGVYSLYANLHFTSGIATNATHPLLIGRYQDATQPVDDRVKNIYMPSRVQVGKGMIHQLIPKNGFLREYLDPSIATFHHFRECKTKTSFAVSAYSNGSTKLIRIRCDSLMKYNSTAIQQLLNLKIILTNILNVFRTLKI